MSKIGDDPHPSGENQLDIDDEKDVAFLRPQLKRAKTISDLFGKVKAQYDKLSPNEASMIIDHMRPNVEHKNLSRNEFTLFAVTLGITVVVGFVVCFYFVVDIVDTDLHVGLKVLAAVGMVLGVILIPLVYLICSRSSLPLTHEFNGMSSIMEYSYYQDISLLNRAWKQSPYRKVLWWLASEAGVVVKELVHKGGDGYGSVEGVEKKEKGEPLLKPALGRQVSVQLAVPWDTPKSVVVLQPREGYCAIATLNSVLRSIPRFKLVPFSIFPAPYTAEQLKIVIDELIAMGNDKLNVVESVETISGSASFKTIVAHFKEANKENVRILVNFHRAPLFFAQAEGCDQYRKRFAGHWSPLISYIPGPIQQNLQAQPSSPSSSSSASAFSPALAAELDGDFCCMMDVNDSYGTYMVPAKRLWQGVNTVDGQSGQFRGLLKIVLKNNMFEKVTGKQKVHRP